MSPKRTRGKCIILSATVVGAVGCSDVSGPSAIDEALTFDVAIVAADATLEDLALWSQPFVFGPLPAPPPSHVPGRPGGHDGWAGELSGTHSVTFYDADGIEQAGYDPVTTAAIHIFHEIMGDVTREDLTVSVHRERDMEVSGLAGEEARRTWNGTGSEQVSRDRFLEGGVVRSYDAVGAFSYHDVVVPIPGTVPPYPVSGSISRSMTVTLSGPDGERTRAIDVSITFDGTAIATAIVNGEEMEIDLSAVDGQVPVRRLRR